MESQKPKLPDEQDRNIGDLLREAPSLLEEQKEKGQYSMSDCHCPCPKPLNAVVYVTFSPL